MVSLKCVHVLDGTTCNRKFERRLSRIHGSHLMCTFCAGKERARPRCRSCGDPDHMSDKCPKQKPSTARRKCQLCFGTPHMVEGAACKGCGLAYEDEVLPTARQPVVPRVLPKPRPVIAEVRVKAIRIDGDTQARVMLDERTIDEYAEAIKGGARLPPVVVFYDGTAYWLGDGYHRVYAHVRLGTLKTECEIRGGGRRDAILYAVGANAIHGLKRSNADKHRAVEMLLLDAEWARNSNRWIAERCSVSSDMVDRARRALRPAGQLPVTGSSQVVPEQPVTRKGVDGKVRRLPVRCPPPFSMERARTRIEGLVEALLAAWPEGSSLEPLALWLEGGATRVRSTMADQAGRRDEARG